MRLLKKILSRYFGKNETTPHFPVMAEYKKQPVVPPIPENPPPYRVYTHAFDQIVTAGELTSVLGELSLADAAVLEDSWHTFSNSLQAWRTRHHLAAFAASSALRTVATDATRSETLISLLLDQSGSMRGQNMLLAAAAVDVAQDFLTHLGCSVEILGFTTSSWKGGKSRQKWLSRTSIQGPGRLCDLLHVIYRSAADNRGSTGNYAFKAMLRPDLPKENVDGEALEWAADRLRARPETRKLLLVISDGAPVDDSTLASNDAGILERHLLKTIGNLEASDDIQLSALGIGFDVSRYYSSHAMVQTPEDLGGSLIELLEVELHKAWNMQNAAPKSIH